VNEWEKDGSLLLGLAVCFSSKMVVEWELLGGLVQRSQKIIMKAGKADSQPPRKQLQSSFFFIMVSNLVILWLTFAARFDHNIYES